MTAASAPPPEPECPLPAPPSIGELFDGSDLAPTDLAVSGQPTGGSSHHQAEQELLQSRLQQATGELKVKADELELLKSRLASIELRVASTETPSQQLSKDKEIAALRQQLKQAVSANRSLGATNKSLLVDLSVFRRFIQCSRAKRPLLNEAANGSSKRAKTSA